MDAKTKMNEEIRLPSFDAGARDGLIDDGVAPSLAPHIAHALLQGMMRGAQRVEGEGGTVSSKQIYTGRSIRSWTTFRIRPSLIPHTIPQRAHPSTFCVPHAYRRRPLRLLNPLPPKVPFTHSQFYPSSHFISITAAKVQHDGRIRRRREVFVLIGPFSKNATRACQKFKPPRFPFHCFSFSFTV